MKKSFLILFFSLIFTVCGYTQATNLLRAKCPNETPTKYASFTLNGDGTITTIPCTNKGIYIDGVLQPSFVTSSNALANAPTIGDYIFNTVTPTKGIYRQGGFNSYLERTVDDVVSPYNQMRVRTNETAGCCGGFAELYLISDNTHSYAYIRAQRSVNSRGDDFFVSNFFDNNKFKMFLNMDAIETHPLEDTSRFRVGNFTDSTNFIDLENVTNKLTLQAAKIRINPTGIVPPVTATACELGQIYFDTGFLYICVATNTVKRVALASF